MTGWESLFEPSPIWERVVFTLVVGVVTFFKTLHYLKYKATHCYVRDKTNTAHGICESIKTKGNEL
jgi:hypothetical protein